MVSTVRQEKKGGKFNRAFETCKNKKFISTNLAPIVDNFGWCDFSVVLRTEDDRGSRVAAVVGEGLGGVARANTQELKLGCGDIIVQLGEEQHINMKIMVGPTLKEIIKHPCPSVPPHLAKLNSN